MAPSPVWQPISEARPLPPAQFALPARGRLARRLFALFVLVALLPLSLSDWLSHTAVTQVAEDLHQRRHTQTTRQVSRQVYDRLLAAQLLLGTWPDTPPQAGGPGTLAGLGTVFSQAARIGEDGQTQWHSPTGAAASVAALEVCRAACGLAATAGASSPGSGRRASPTVRLHAAHVPGAPTGVWLVTLDRGARWIAEVHPAHLWAPVAQSGDDAAWQVLDAQGKTLVDLRGPDYPMRLAAPGEGAPPPSVLDTEARLFLGGSFDSGDWRFVQRTLRPQVRWQGWPLGLWLALMATATLLTIAWLARRQIQRLLEPLERLTEGTSQLAAGRGSTRVAVRRDDEIGMLAGAFNQMAGRIEAQFDALAGMTAIDHDILGGTPLDQVVDRVLQRLRADAPGLAARIAWLQAGGRLSLAGSTAKADAGAVDRTSITLDAAGMASFQALSGDVCGPVQPWCDAPWLPDATGAGNSDTVLVLPVRLQGRSGAVVALRLGGPLPDEWRQRACELRDRLSVAMAARAREDELVHRAAHDSLTGLANRYGLHQRLDALLNQQAPVLAVLFIDLDHFKDVNDSRGHAAGDALLCEASARLQDLAPAGAVLARPGGDEFTLLLPGAGAAQAQACAHAIVAALARPFLLQDSQHVLGASVGMALCPVHGDNRGELMRRADVALYAAKAGGRNAHVMFTPELDVAANDRLQLLTELRRAVEQSEFVVHYQPRVLSADGSIRSAEALVRWEHPERGLVMPGGFIGLAESSGLIDAIGSLVLEGTCRQLAQWQRAGLLLDRVSVNVSPQQLVSGRLPAQVRSLLDRHGLPGHLLEIEVTESLLVGDSGTAAAQLAQLRAWGVTIALDDFGTGYSSMSTLRQLPIDVMKVDRSFVTDVCEDQGALAVASAIVAMAQAMSLHLVAEGVETEAQAHLLGRLGCHELQGFLYSRALPAAQFERLPGLRHKPDPAADAGLLAREVPA